MKTPPFVEPIVNAIGDISITEALDAIDREFAKLPEPTDGAEGVLSMTVARLGGTVEGAPTQRVNFIQRIDELRRIEEQHYTAMRNIHRRRAVPDALGYGRLLELCDQFGITETDDLKHRLEDWDRWNHELRAENGLKADPKP